ncbi:MAG: HTH domain-containing protein [Caldiserica bacterium]|nr:HTH domain-containing protein [Caldisericota bacterium]
MIKETLELLKTKRLTIDQLAQELMVTRQVADSIIDLLEKKGRLVRLETGIGVVYAVMEKPMTTNGKLTPSIMIEFIKSHGFSTISQAATTLGVTYEDVKKMLDSLFARQHLKRIDIAKENNCAGNCSGCHGCDHAAMIQIDGTTTCYQLTAHNL